MGPDSVGGQVQPLGYFATSRALGKTGQHVPLSRRKSGKKLVVVLLQLASGHEQPQHVPDLSPWQPGFPTRYAPDHAKQMLQ